MRELARKIAKTLLKIGAVGFKPKNPITFKSGLISPVYVDNRIFPFYPKEWRLVIRGMKNLIKEKKLLLDVVAGVEAAGIPHSATLGYELNKPSVFVRKKTKNHGTKKMVEGGNVKRKKVLLIEDLVTTGSSSLAGVKSLREAGAQVKDCLVIISYGFKEAEKAFEVAKVKLHSLTDFHIVLDEAGKLGKFNKSERKILDDWLSQPWGWAKKYGF
ncbi:MAG: orotate phosphoribosyltransferase [Patescibacteria group bacterium]|nr:orotate phosphoribosyltransferase [Patescibacteria group bacterium]